MKSIEFKRSLLTAAVIGALSAAPAFAADNGARNSKSGDTAKMQGSDRSSSTASTSSLQPCSSYKNPNAGKLADKSTGAAKEHSASPVHQDCIDDNGSNAST